MALAPPGRISQLLPSVKCSNCNLPVPLNELGDHTCSKQPPVPALPIPSVTPAAALSLLPPRLKARVSPATDAPPVERLRVNTAPTGPYQQKSSPLARHASPIPQPGPSNHHHSPSRSRPVPNPDFRTRSSSNVGPGPSSTHPGPSPSTPRPSFSANHITPPPTSVIPPSPQPTYHSEAEIDTKSGGEAGMAGVGRRGFAAAARAAMLVAPSAASRRANAPGLLDIQVPTRGLLFLFTSIFPFDSPFTATDTPPLSAGSGYSSHSPGVSPYPQSPGPPSPTMRYREKAPAVEPPSSPTSIRIPLFEKFRNQLPGVIVPNNNTSPLPNTDSNNDTTPSTALPPRTETRQSTTSTSSAYSRSYSHRTTSIISNSRSRQDHQTVTRPRSPSSGSEFGLAYADSTDNEEENHKGDVRKTKANPPPPLPLTSSILRSGSIATTNHVRFPSTSEYSERSARIPVPKPGHHRGSSASSASSAGGDDAGSAKTNSEVIAHALGLSRTPPSNYTRLGGPGSTMGGRIARSTSGSSSSGRSAYSLGTNSTSIKTGDSNSGVRPGSHSAAVSPTDEPEPLRGLSKSKSTSRQNKSFLTESEDDGVKLASTKSVAAPMAHRSNTVQVPVSYSADKPKLVARARTSTEKQTEAVREKKERIRKLRVCVKCDKRIEDGRWIQVDGGAVLCEHCWKNMYLPKVSLFVGPSDVTFDGDVFFSAAGVNCLSRNKPCHLKTAS